MKIHFNLLTENAFLPTMNYSTDAGIDLYSPKTVDIPAHGAVIIETNVSWKPQLNFFEKLLKLKPFGLIQSRSGLASHFHIEASNAGVIDAEYDGNIKVILYNNSNKDYTVKRGDRIAQMIPYLIPFISYKTFNKSDSRGNKGFGSSGK